MQTQEINRRKFDAHLPRRILTGLIMSKAFLGQVSDILAVELDLFPENHFRTVAGWCLDFFTDYGTAPGEAIQDLYLEWADDDVQEPETIEAVHDLLENLSEHFTQDEDELNVPFLVDQLAELLNKRKLKKLNQDVDDLINAGQQADAETLIETYRSVLIGQGVGFDPLNDLDVWNDVFDQSNDALFRMPGSSGDFFQSVLVRDSLLGIQAPEKTGKTMWCMEFVHYALRNRRKVAFFQVGDLSKGQVLRRLGVKLSQHPMFEYQCRKPIDIPTGLELDEEAEAGYRVISRATRFKEPASPAIVKRAIQRFKRSLAMPKLRSFLKISVHSNSSINVRGITGILDSWAVDEGFIPDVIVIDYADILAPEDTNSKTTRDQINDTWKALRKLSQDRHCLVICPTQADAGSYYAEGNALQSMKNFSEDKRKYAHVTGMLGLNRTAADVEAGGMRLNWIVLREASFNIKRALYCATCYPLGRALAASAF